MTPARPSSRVLRLLGLVAVALACAALPAAAQVDLCMEAERFLRESMEMQAISEPDTIDDWRTQAMVPGCRVTAAGATTRTPTELARGFFEVLAASGWSRTPDPRDAPNEASLRYRRLGADCLFTYYDGSSTLNTEAEFTVSDAVEIRPGERLFYFLVMCTPAAPAAERGGAPALHSEPARATLASGRPALVGADDLHSVPRRGAP